MDAVDSLISQVQALAKNADEGIRKKMLDSLFNLQLSLETPQDSMHRMLYLNIQLAAVRIGCDLDLFKLLADSPEPLTAVQVAEKCGTAPLLMTRLLRYLGSVGIIKETDPNTYTANDWTRVLTQKGWHGSVYHYFDLCSPAIAATPDFLKQHGYKDIVSPADLPFQVAHKTPLTPFEFLMQPKEPNAGLFAHFNNFMTVQRQGMPTWLDAYPYHDLVKKVNSANQKNSGAALFVDVGGNVGHQSFALRAALPADVHARIVVQDQGPVIEQAKKMQQQQQQQEASADSSNSVVELTAHNFFDTQPERGAAAYYLRNIIHDWPDERAVAILRQLRDAMAEADDGAPSVLLIDDMVVPDRHPHWQTTQLDMLMMTVLAAQERTRAQFEALVAKAGLRVRNVYPYTLSLNDCIIECVVA